MPSKTHRITTKNFKALIKNGKRFNTLCFSFLYLPANNYRFSIVIPKKVAKKAVARNKIKRQAREITKKIVLDKNIHNMHFVVFLKQNCKFGKFRDLESLLKQDFEKFLTKTNRVS